AGGATAVDAAGGSGWRPMTVESTAGSVRLRGSFLGPASRMRAGSEPGPRRAGVLRKNGRDHVRQPQNVARVVANEARRLGRESLAPDGRVERVAQLTLEGQREVGGCRFAPEPS